LELRRCTYVNCASHALTRSRLRSKSRGNFSTPRTRLRFTAVAKLSPSQRHLPGTHCQYWHSWL